MVFVSLHDIGKGGRRAHPVVNDGEGHCADIASGGGTHERKGGVMVGTVFDPEAGLAEKELAAAMVNL